MSGHNDVWEVALDVRGCEGAAPEEGTSVDRDFDHLDTLEGERPGSSGRILFICRAKGILIPIISNTTEMFGLVIARKISILKTLSFLKREGNV